jgi:uncharacterized protein YjbJ (UPF0337 family)
MFGYRPFHFVSCISVHVICCIVCGIFSRHRNLGTVIGTRRYLFDNAYPKENGMDWNRVEGNWKEAKGKVKEKWGQLTDDDLTQVNGQRDQLEGKIQQRYGLAKDAVRKNVDDWLKSQP